MKAWKRSLAAGGVLAIVGASVVVGMGSAQAATVVTVTPHANIKNGTAVKVHGTGFTPMAQVAMGECPIGVEAKGPGYCASQLTGGSYLGVANAQGVVDHTLNMTVGPLNNTIGKPATCDATHPCQVEVENISKHSEYGAVKLEFVGAKAATTSTTTKSAGTSKTSTTSSGTTTTNVSATKTTTAADPATTLPHTGAGSTVLVALIGFALLQLGMIAAVRATRASPRRVRL